ncbi:hypothetical protein KCU81_g7962, partial [Aureobasidium melanogenum]|uniref:Uncharacterized protein n=1 Tax=Aureobasidium melanogenum (strain CBS 110374) TaxID=1043003 RepID=A0A074VYY8_AURM1
MRFPQKNSSLVIFLAALSVPMSFAKDVPKQEILGMDQDMEIDLQSKPTLARFPIEDLSPTEWQAEHERVRAELGDEAYLALRQSEIDKKSESVLRMIVAGQLKFPPIKGSHQPDRIGLGDGREFRIGVAQGVPEDITDAMYASFGDGVDVEIPEEWLEYEVSAEELEREERQANEEREQREQARKLDILEGRLSVRDYGMDCLSPAKGASDLDKRKT